MTATQRLAKAYDRQIDASFTRTCCNIPINVMDIGKIYAVGRGALAQGLDLDTTIRAFVETIRQDREKTTQGGR